MVNSDFQLGQSSGFQAYLGTTSTLKQLKCHLIQAAEEARKAIRSRPDWNKVSETFDLHHHIIKLSVLLLNADMYFSRQPESMGLVIFLSAAFLICFFHCNYDHKPGRSGVLKSSRLKCGLEDICLNSPATVPCTL